MTFSDDCLEGRSQHFTFPRRELLQNFASAALLFVASGYQSAAKIPEKYPAPTFQIGDKVADHWTDEFGLNFIEFGEVVGSCWQPDEEVWGYHVNWTSGTSNAEYYPCFDGHLVIGGDLRLVSHD